LLTPKHRHSPCSPRWCNTEGGDRAPSWGGAIDCVSRRKALFCAPGGKRK
jgi:hypothetical protein